MLVVVYLISSSSVKTRSEVRYPKTTPMLSKLKNLFVLRLQPRSKLYLNYLNITGGKNAAPAPASPNDHSVNNNKVKHSEIILGFLWQENVQQASLIIFCSLNYIHYCQLEQQSGQTDKYFIGFIMLPSLSPTAMSLIQITPVWKKSIWRRNIILEFAIKLLLAM